MPFMKPQEQARKSYTAQKLYRTKRNVNTSAALEAKALGGDVALEAKALGGGRVEVPETFVAVTATHRKMANNLEGYTTAIEHAIRQLGLGGALGASGEEILERIPTIGKWPHRFAVAWR